MTQLILWILLGLYAVDVGLHLFACFTRRTKLRRPTKVLLMPLLCGCYWTLTLALGSRPNAFVIAALLCGCLGDAFLLFPKQGVLLLCGMAAFALGHVLYVAAMLATEPILRWPIFVCIAFVLGWVVILRVALVSKAPKRLHAPGYAYGLLLSGTAICACYLMLMRRLPNWYMLSFLGGVLFMTSDTILVRREYLRSTRYGNFWVMLTYILAQTCLVTGFALNGGI